MIFLRLYADHNNFSLLERNIYLDKAKHHDYSKNFHVIFDLLTTLKVDLTQIVDKLILMNLYTQELFLRN